MKSMNFSLIVCYQTIWTIDIKYFIKLIFIYIKMSLTEAKLYSIFPFLQVQDKILGQSQQEKNMCKLHEKVCLFFQGHCELQNQAFPFQWVSVRSRTHCDVSEVRISCMVQSVHLSYFNFMLILFIKTSYAIMPDVTGPIYVTLVCHVLKLLLRIVKKSWQSLIMLTFGK